MPTNRRNVAVLVALAFTAAFSTASISTAYYYHASQVSGLECQEDASSKARLAYTTRGIINQSRKKTGIANCPIEIGAAGSYTVNTVVFAEDAGVGIHCELIEIDVYSGDAVRIYPNSTFVGGGSTSLMTWYDVELTVSSGMFTLSCDLPGRTGILSTSVSSDRM